MLTPEVNALKGMGYHPQAYISDDNIAMAVLDLLERGWDGENFTEVTNNLRNSDPYMVMADFKDYRRAQQDRAEAVQRPRDLEPHEPDEHRQCGHLLGPTAR